MRKITLIALLFTFVGVMPMMAQIDCSKKYSISSQTNPTSYLLANTSSSIITLTTTAPSEFSDEYCFRFIEAGTSGDGKQMYKIVTLANNYFTYKPSNMGSLYIKDSDANDCRWIVEETTDGVYIYWAQYNDGVYSKSSYSWYPIKSNVGRALTLNNSGKRTLVLTAVGDIEGGGESGGGESGGDESEESDTKNAPTNVTVSQAPTANGWDVNTKFYTIKNGNNKFLNGDVVKSGTNYLSLTSSSTPDESGYWCVTGNDTEGYSFYNYETGKILAMTANTADESNAFAWLEDANAASGYNTKFTFTKSKKGGDYWCIKVKDSENSYWTQHGNEQYGSYNCLSYWNSEMAVNGWENSGTGDNGSAFIFAAVDVKLPINLTLAEITNTDNLLYGLEGYITTFSAPYATTIPVGVTAYYAESVENSDVVTLSELGEGVVPASFGVVLVSETQNVKMVETNSTVETPQNAFSHSASGSVELGENCYVLANGQDGKGLYLAKTGLVLPANKAYLQLPASSQTSAFRFVVGETTAIQGVATENANTSIYDLSGRRVFSTTKGGVYIQNGKKFIVK